MKTGSLITSLVCHQCGTEYDPASAQTFCQKDNEPLVTRYNLKNGLSKTILQGRASNMWRYRELLPVLDNNNIISLGEGMSPILSLDQLKKRSRLKVQKILLKDEGQNPTGSFKARGLSMAVSKAYELGIKEMSIPTAGNAGSALAAYCARAGMTAHIFMPKQTPQIFRMDNQIMGSSLRIIDGDISDCGKAMRLENTDNQWFDVTTLKEPYRLEGKKTMGFEIAEQLQWELPDVIIYPTGGGTGLIGIWKAFKELKQLGWISKIKTRMVAVQSDGCDPIVSAFEKEEDHSIPYTNPKTTIANGLRVPHAFGHKLILKTIKESKGTALSVNDEEMKTGIKELAENEGLFVAPEGAATWIALKKLVHQGWIHPSENVLLLNTGSAYKYAENLH